MQQKHRRLGREHRIAAAQINMQQLVKAVLWLILICRIGVAGRARRFVRRVQIPMYLAREANDRLDHHAQQRKQQKKAAPTGHGSGKASGHEAHGSEFALSYTITGVSRAAYSVVCCQW